MTISEKFLNEKQVIISEYPQNFIPSGATLIDETSDECTIKGFYDQLTGVTHIQEIIELRRNNADR